MRKNNFGKSFAAFVMVWTMLIFPIASFAQTRVEMPKNKYKVQDDVKIGREASQEVEKQFPILNDYQATRYVENVGERLVRAIPPQFQNTALLIIDSRLSMPATSTLLRFPADRCMLIAE